MINAIRSLLRPQPDQPVHAIADIDLAAAALLIEVMVIDQKATAAEEAAIKSLLRERFNIDPAAATALFEAAREAVTKATSLFQFTRQINDEFDPQQKFELVVQLWKIAYADGNLDKYEEHIIRRISELIYLPHSQFIRAKQKGIAELKTAD